MIATLKTLLKLAGAARKLGRITGSTAKWLYDHQDQLGWIHKWALRIFHWWADTAWRSWLAHTAVATAIALAFCAVMALFGRAHGGFVVGAGVAFGLYMVREIGDWIRYARAHTLDEVVSGVDHRSDGVGDLLGPLAIFIGAFLEWWV